jgi:Lsr2
MATRTITVDDLTGNEALVTRKYQVIFNVQDAKSKLESADVVFDLTDDSAQAIWRWLTEGDTRDLAGLLPRRVRIGQTGDSAENTEIRAWARTQPEFKDNIKDRGAIPADVVEAYRKAHPTT